MREVWKIYAKPLQTFFPISISQILTVCPGPETLFEQKRVIGLSKHSTRSNFEKKGIFDIDAQEKKCQNGHLAKKKKKCGFAILALVSVIQFQKFFWPK